MAGTLYILIGPSGVGKNTVQDIVLRDVDNMETAKGVFTRPYRPNENADSVSISLDQFNDLRDAGLLTAVNQVHGNWYGTPIGNISEPLERGKDVIRIFTPDGTDQAIEHLRHYSIVTIFLVARPEALLQRLVRRGDKPDDIVRRMKTTEYELTRQDDFHFKIDAERDPEAVASDVKAIINDIRGGKFMAHAIYEATRA